MTSSDYCMPTSLALTVTTKSTHRVLHILTVVSLSLACLLSPAQALGNSTADELPKSRSSWPSSVHGATKVVSSTSYTVGTANPTNKDTSSVVFNTKPISLTTTTDKKDNKQSSSQQTATYFINNECYGPNCPQNKNRGDSIDGGWESYYTTLNKGVDPKYWKKNGETIHGRNSLSFTVKEKPEKSENSSGNREGHAISLTRRTQPTTTAPGWVKLQPVFPAAYDPFRVAKDSTSTEEDDSESKASTRVSHYIPKPTFQINRIGEELSPESFAARWGWGNKNQNNEGSRLPQWLVELNDSLHKANANKHRFQDRVGDRKWVKLEPIPVAGVSISKWVPQGTPTKDLPSTNWPSRDRPNAWWDRVDAEQNSYNGGNSQFGGGRLPFPVLSPTSSSNYGPSSNHNSNNNYNKPILHQQSGWGSTATSSDTNRGPTNNWRDIIYPEGPSSATVSWLSHKGISKYPSSFTARPTHSFSDIRKPATGSWSASRRHTSYPPVNRVSSQSNYGPQSSYRPVKSNTRPDDPRWVLISQTRPVAGFDSDSNRGSSYGNNNNNELPAYLSHMHSGFDRVSDFPFHEANSHNRRSGKTLKKRKSYEFDQDEVFRKLNETLMNLRPVLNTGRSGLEKLTQEILNNSKKDTLPENSVDSEDYFEEQIHSSIRPYMDLKETGRAVGRRKSFNMRRGLTLNPVLAAVGAGMIPATMAAVLPVVMGRRKRSIGDEVRSSTQYAPNIDRASVLSRRIAQ